MRTNLIVGMNADKSTSEILVYYLRIAFNTPNKFERTGLFKSIDKSLFQR